MGMLLESLPKSLTRVPVELGRAEHLAHVTCPLYCEVRQELLGLYIYHALSKDRHVSVQQGILLS